MSRPSGVPRHPLGQNKQAQPSVPQDSGDGKEEGMAGIGGAEGQAVFGGVEEA